MVVSWGTFAMPNFRIPTPAELGQILLFLQRVGSDQTLPKELHLRANALALCFRDPQEVQEQLAAMLDMLLETLRDSTVDYRMKARIRSTLKMLADMREEADKKG